METPRSGAITLEVVLRFVDIAADALADAREEIDALNVYPVPDGDTGTNMYLSICAARDAVREAAAGHPAADLGPALAALGRGALLGGGATQGSSSARCSGRSCAGSPPPSRGSATPT